MAKVQSSLSTIMVVVILVPMIMTMMNLVHCLPDQQVQASPTDESMPDLADTSCIIGRLRQCMVDEDCVQSGENSQRGQCICRDHANCVRKGTGNASEPSSSSSSSTPPFFINSSPSSRISTPRSSTSAWKIFVSTFSMIMLVGAVGGSVYFYCFRYGLAEHYARRLGLNFLTRPSARVEHQLLNQMSSSNGTSAAVGNHHHPLDSSSSGRNGEDLII